ncbi:hypothetical protein [Nocardioides abyssi]|uniref:Uncharacterized protein n=1 Tax=Nocardioides abyssi TaxID=3058370 RepID=A0ABT8EZL5_9ACTN|nr:hypothetical protein [Nocardioides abyssi]MDN4163251.1 hypothetical protein [Nocardioides abyssi]
MATLTIHDDVLSLRLTRAEKVLGLLRDLDVPLSSVVSADVVADGRDAIRGVRAPGYAVPGHRFIGTWRGAGRRLVDVRPGRPALRVRLDGQRYDELLVQVDDAASLAGSLTRSLTPQPARRG